MVRIRMENPFHEVAGYKQGALRCLVLPEARELQTDKLAKVAPGIWSRAEVQISWCCHNQCGTLSWLRPWRGPSAQDMAHVRPSLLAGRAGPALLLPFPGDGYCWECQVSHPIPASPGLTWEMFKLPEPASIFLENTGLDYFYVVLLFLLCIPGERDVLAPSLHPPGFLQRPRWALGSGKSHCPRWANPQSWGCWEVPQCQPCLPGASRCPAVPGVCQGAQGLRLWASCSV